MSTQLTEEQNNFIGKIAKEKGFSEFNVTCTSASGKGDNFLGIVTSVVVESGERKLELILKAAHQNEAFRKAAPLRLAYLREIYVYEQVFEEFKKFEEEYGVLDRFTTYPKFYGASSVEGNEFLIMENLRAEKYQLWNKRIPMNAGHLSAVIKAYAKFHAISLALSNKNPEYFEKLTENMKKNIFESEGNFNDQEKFDIYVKSCMENGYKVVEGNPVLKDFLTQAEPLITKLIFKDVKEPEYKLVLTHGDCWCNNFMFKYKDNHDVTEPSDLRIIDWQISCLSSPAQDFCYFFLAHSSKEDLQNHKNYLELYHNTLSKQLRHFGCDPNELFPYTRFEEHIKKYMLIEMFVCFMVYKILLCDTDDAPDLVDITESNKDLFKEMNFKIKNVDAYEERLKDLIIFIKANYPV